MRFEELKQTYLNRWKNLNQGIPLNPKYKRLKETLPSWDVAEAISLMGGSGAGKTRFIFKIAVLDSLEYLKKNKGKMRMRILFNSLEIPELELYTMLVCHFFYTKLNISIEREHLLNKFQKEEIDETLFENLEKIREDIEFFNSVVTIVDNIRSGEEWFLYCKKCLDDAGTIDANGKYQKKDLHLHWMIITDTLNAVKVPRGSTKLVEMTKYSAEYMKQTLRGFYGATCIQTQQIEKGVQSSQYTSKGERVEEKFLISSSDGKDYKSSEDDNSTVLGLFLPHKYRLPKWEGYDVEMFNKHLSFIYILKSNFTPTDIDKPIAFYIDHSLLIYEEIPEDPTEFKQFCEKMGIQVKKEKERRSFLPPSSGN